MAPRKSTKKSVAPTTESQEVPQEVPEVQQENVVETPDVKPEVQDEQEVETVQQNDVDKYVVVLEILQRQEKEIKNAIALVKTLQKEHAKLQKASVKRPKKGANTQNGTKTRTPSGFAKPTKLSDDLCSFLGVPNGSQMARTDVTRVINEYIKKNSLQDTKDKRTIVPDEKLMSILKLGDDDKLTYFNLQKFIKHQFQKV
jgi:chromatin remodeling complex protein RSC6